MQIIIKSKTSMKRIARACNSVPSMQPYRDYAVNEEGRALHDEICGSPVIEEGAMSHNAIIIMSAHLSGATWIHRGSASTMQLRTLIPRILQMYADGHLIGDLLIHKTSINTTELDALYPIVFNEPTGNEYWFITGLVDWLPKLDMFLNDSYAHTNSVGTIEVPDDVIRAGLTAYNVADCELKRTQNSRRCLKKLWQRANWLHIIKNSLNDDLHNEFAVYMGGRYGYAMYKNGKAYTHQYGRNQANHIIDVHPNRKTTFDSVFSPVEFKDIDYGAGVREDKNGIHRLHMFFNEETTASEPIIAKDRWGSTLR